MKYFTSIIILTAVIFTALFSTSCNSNKTEEASASDYTANILSVDSLMANAETYVGDTIIVEGICSHLCKHGGRKAFIMSNDSSQVLRCEATSAIGGAFSPECVGHKLSVVGVVCENRIGEPEILEMEAQHSQTAGASDHSCATEAKAQGQDSISEFDARMADYRSRISKRLADEGKDYLSFYYIEATSYGIEE